MLLTITGGDLKPGPTYDALKKGIEQSLKQKKYDIGDVVFTKIIGQKSYYCRLTGRDGDRYKITVTTGAGAEL